MRCFTIIVFALLSMHQSASAERIQVLSPSPDEDETLELAPASTDVDDGPYPMLWGKIVAVGETVDDYIENFNKELESYLSMQDWNFTDGAYFDDSELVEALGLDLQEWPDSTGLNFADMETPVLLEVGSALGAWKATKKTKFVPEEWQPLVADIGHFVGSGTFGNVYVIDTTMGMKKERDSTVAMKVEKKLGDIKASEVKLGKKFDHPNLVKVWDASHFRKRVVMLMESLPGGDLEEGYNLVGSRRGRKAVVRAMLEMFAALHYLHKAGYVHSDFKPAQVILSKKTNGIAKLGDFGLACKEGSDDIAGSPIFMSPELLDTSKRTSSVDMWAMGISLYLLFNNDQVPPSLRGAPTTRDLLRKIRQLKSSHVLHPGGSPLDDLIKGLLTVRVSSRFDSEEALEQAIRWAKYEGIALSEIQTIVTADLTGKRDVLPAAWKQCVKLSCEDEPCKEIAASPLKVRCGNVVQPDPNDPRYAMSNFSDQHKPVKHQPSKDNRNEAKDDRLHEHQAQQADRLQQLLNQVNIPKQGAQNNVNAPLIAEHKDKDNPVRNIIQQEVPEDKVNAPRSEKPKGWDNPVHAILQQRRQFLQNLQREVPIEERLERKDCSAVHDAIPRESAWRHLGINCKCPENQKVWCGRVEIARQKFKLGEVANCGFGLSCSEDAPY